jgi:hypothetical protein
MRLKTLLAASLSAAVLHGCVGIRVDPAEPARPDERGFSSSEPVAIIGEWRWSDEDYLRDVADRLAPDDASRLAQHDLLVITWAEAVLVFEHVQRTGSPVTNGEIDEYLDGPLAASPLAARFRNRFHLRNTLLLDRAAQRLREHARQRFAEGAAVDEWPSHYVPGPVRAEAVKSELERTPIWPARLELALRAALADWALERAPLPDGRVPPTGR